MADYADDFGIEIHCVYSHLRDPNELRANPANPNQHSAHQLQLLASIIQEQGWRNPITVSKRSGLVVRGHGRVLRFAGEAADRGDVHFLHRRGERVAEHFEAFVEQRRANRGRALR